LEEGEYLPKKSCLWLKGVGMKDRQQTYLEMSLMGI